MSVSAKQLCYGCGMTHSPVLRVALAVPLRALFDYLPPENIDISSLNNGLYLLEIISSDDKTYSQKIQIAR